MKVTSTSRDSARVDDIVLRETKTTRLLFRPLLVNNARDGRASVKGTFVFQKKSRAQQWEDHKELDLTQLKAEEWIKLELKSEEVLTLFQELMALYELYDEEGIPAGEFNYVRAVSGLVDLLYASESQFESLLQDQPNNAHKVLERLLSWFLARSDCIGNLDLLESLDAKQLSHLSELAGLKKLREVLQVWNENQDNSNEEFWQKCLGENGFVLSQVFAFPIVIVKDKAYVGGKLVTNRGGKIVDFLLKNEISHNAILVEIKTPTTSLLGSTSYRSGIYGISSEISGTVVQVLTYRQNLITERHLLGDDDDEILKFDAFEPTVVIIAGNSALELTDKAKRQSFELFRSQLRYIQLITYDELFAKINSLINLLEGEGGETDEFLVPEGVDWPLEEDAPIEENDIPF